MQDAKASARGPFKSAGFYLATGAASAILAAGMLILTAPRPAQATPQFAQQTGLSCGQCHVSPAGGGALKPLGKRFKANGDKLPKKK